MRVLYIEKMDKPIWGIKKIKFEQDNCKISFNVDKERKIKKVMKRLIKNEVTNVVLSREFDENKDFINALNASNINIFNGRWLQK